jgi:hypothetical protein
MANETQALHRIERLLWDVLSKQDTLMSGMTDLQAAMTANAAAVTAAANEINALATKLVAAANGDSDGDVETLAQQLQVQTSQLTLAVNNAVNPPAPAAPNTGGAATTTVSATPAAVQNPAPAATPAA